MVPRRRRDSLTRVSHFGPPSNWPSKRVRPGWCPQGPPGSFHDSRRPPVLREPSLCAIRLAGRTGYGEPRDEVSCVLHRQGHLHEPHRASPHVAALLAVELADDAEVQGLAGHAGRREAPRAVSACVAVAWLTLALGVPTSKCELV